MRVGGVRLARVAPSTAHLDPDEPVTELFRNGIVHGMLTDHDNDVVAVKGLEPAVRRRRLGIQPLEAGAAPEGPPIETTERRGPGRLRWIRSGEDGRSAVPNERGSWRLMTWTFEAMRAERGTSQRTSP